MSVCSGRFIVSYFFILCTERALYIFNDWWLATWTAVSSGTVENTSELYDVPFVQIGGVVMITPFGEIATDELNDYYMYVCSCM